MTYDVLIKEEAQADTLTAYLYYEEKREGLGERFLKELTARYQQIAQNPQHYGYLSTDKEKTLRKIKVNRFPYIIVYDYTATTVTIYLVHNCYKNMEDNYE